jgi:hypothetical protein
MGGTPLLSRCPNGDLCSTFQMFCRAAHFSGLVARYLNDFAGLEALVTYKNWPDFLYIQRKSENF